MTDMRLTHRDLLLFIFVFRSFPFPGTSINYLVSGGCIFFSFFTYVFFWLSSLYTEKKPCLRIISTSRKDNLFSFSISMENDILM